MIVSFYRRKILTLGDWYGLINMLIEHYNQLLVNSTKWTHIQFYTNTFTLYSANQLFLQVMLTFDLGDRSQAILSVHSFLQIYRLPRNLKIKMCNLIVSEHIDETIKMMFCLVTLTFVSYTRLNFSGFTRSYFPLQSENFKLYNG